MVIKIKKIEKILIFFIIIINEVISMWFHLFLIYDNKCYVFRRLQMHAIQPPGRVLVFSAPESEPAAAAGSSS
jgi:hypothetical protein